MRSNFPHYFSACCAWLLLSGSPVCRAQLAKAYSAPTAYSILNPSVGSAAVSTSYVGNVATVSAPTPSVTNKTKTTVGLQGNHLPSVSNFHPLVKKWRIAFGLPAQIALDYAYLRARMVSEYENDPDIYNYRSPAFKEAVDILGWAEFVKISDWAPVKCQLHFRFISPVLETDFRINNNRQFNPASAPVKGTSTFWIR